MANLAERYIDLLASGDQSKINCVLKATFGGALTAGVGAAVLASPSNAVPGVGQVSYGVIVGASAVAGLIMGASAGMKMCAGGTEGSLERILTGKISERELNSVEAKLLGIGLTGSEARLAIKAGIVYIMNNGGGAVPQGSIPDRGTMLVLAARLQTAGVA